MACVWTIDGRSSFPRLVFVGNQGNTQVGCSSKAAGLWADVSDARWADAFIEILEILETQSDVSSAVLSSLESTSVKAIPSSGHAVGPATLVAGIT